MTLFDFDSEKENKAVEYAQKAALDWIEKHPNTSIKEMVDHFFPPSPLPFTKADLDSAMVDLLYYGTVDMDADRGLVIRIKR